MLKPEDLEHENQHSPASPTPCSNDYHSGSQTSLDYRPLRISFFLRAHLYVYKDGCFVFYVAFLRVCSGRVFKLLNLGLPNMKSILMINQEWYFFSRKSRILAVILPWECSFFICSFIYLFF